MATESDANLERAQRLMSESSCRDMGLAQDCAHCIAIAIYEAVAAEREACAVLAESRFKNHSFYQAALVDEMKEDCGYAIADDIRARGALPAQGESDG